MGESVPHLNLGAKRDFKNIMVANGYWDDASWSESGVYTFGGETIIEFISFDKFGKAHGPRRDVLFLNEANYLPYNIADQLITRTRSVVWLDWNPSMEFWFYTEMLNKRDDVDFMGQGGNYPPLTYLDNEALDPGSIKEIEAHQHNAGWWKVYGLGQLGELEGKIYKNWDVIEDIPAEARLERRWLDFGYTNDPSAIGDLYYWNGAYVVDEQLYERGLSNKQLAEFLKNLPKCLTIADSAEPKSIDEIRAFGVSILPAVKGKDSVMYGIQQVQGQRIYVTRRSVNIIKENRNYMFLVDRDGRVLNEEDPLCANHHMSGIRYVVNSLIPVIRRRELRPVMPNRAKPRTNAGL